MDTDLTNLKGIGATAAASLSEAGFTTIDEVAKATPGSLGKVRGFGPSRATKIIEAAKALSTDTGNSEPKTTAEAEPAAPEEKPTPKPEVDLDKLAYSGKRADEEEKGGGFIGFITGTWAIVLFIVVLLVIGFAINNPDSFNDLYKTVKSEGETVLTQQSDSDTSEADNGVAEVNVTKNTGSETPQMGISSNTTMVQNDVPMWFADQFRAGIKQPIEPEWVKKQRLESERQRIAAEKYHADMQKRFVSGKPPIAPPWVAQQRAEMEKRSARPMPPPRLDWIQQRRAEAEKYRTRMQRPPMNTLPPNAPNWVKQQHAEAQKRFEEARRQREAFWADRGYPIRP
ncbi:MAG: hypothetical protein GY808_11540 [Gammaproteobacteria bacterium]|nr:hypothetical protein [Gammaproteobacteria bacterium]